MEDFEKTLIIYIGDLVYTPPEDIFLVESDEAYVRACHLLSQCEEQDGTIKLMVRRRSHYLWLRDFTDQIDCPAKYEEKTARLVLADKWNVGLPEWLSDNDIISHGLLDVEVDAHTKSSFETRCLTLFIDSVFSSERLGDEEIVPLIKVRTGAEADQAFENNPLLHRCLQEKCRRWSEESLEPWVNEFCNYLPDRYKHLWHWLSAWSVLNGYPKELLEYVLPPDQVKFISKVPPNAVKDLPLDPAAREQIISQLELFFKEVGPQVKTSADFKKVVGFTSGRLIQEYQYVVAFLQSGQFEADAADIELVKEKFTQCPGISESQLRVLFHYIKPKRPTLIQAQEEWNVGQWTDWTMKEYIPYRTWQINNNYYDDEVEKTVARFSDWYTSEYVSVQKELGLSLTHSLKHTLPSASEFEFTLVLLIDCLPLGFFDIIDQAFQNFGFSRHYLQCRFALLPTITSINKASLMSGEFETSGGDYEAILNKRSVSDWDGRKIIYLSNLKAMSEFNLPEEPAVAVLNYLDGDEMLHTDVESKKTTYEEELHRLYNRVAEEINKIAQQWEGPLEQFNLFVVTDHGACRILEEEKRSFDSKVVKKLFPNEKHRFSLVDEAQVNDVPQNLWDIGYRFEDPFNNNNLIYFLPKGHNTVRFAGAIKRHMHGGVTPEEVIVPFAQYKLVKAPWKKLLFRFPDIEIIQSTGRAKFFIQRVEAIKIELKNPNPTDINILRATVISPETDLKGLDIKIIPAGGNELLRLDCYFKKGAQGERTLEVEIVYEISGEKQTQLVKLESDFKSAVKGGFSLKDL